MTSLPDEAGAARRHDLPRPRRRHVAAVPGRLPRGSPGRVYQSTAADAGRPSADPARSDQAAPLPRAQLDRRVARLSARLRLLLQGGLLRGRQVASTRRPSTRRSPRSIACPAAISTSSTITCSAIAASPRRSSTACAAWDGCGRPPGTVNAVLAPGPARAGGRRPGCAACSSASRRSTRRTSPSSGSTRTCAATTAPPSAGCTTSA